MYIVLSETYLDKKYPNWKELSKEAFDLTLWFEGIDTRQEVEIQSNLPHRDNFGNLTTCNRLVGLERTDREWLYSHKSSIESHYFSAEPSVKADMKALIQDEGAFDKQDYEELVFALKYLENNNVKKDRAYRKTKKSPEEIL